VRLRRSEGFKFDAAWISLCWATSACRNVLRNVPREVERLGTVAECTMIGVLLGGTAYCCKGISRFFTTRLEREERPEVVVERRAGGGWEGVDMMPVCVCLCGGG
jgi:hypothetical protein